MASVQERVVAASRGRDRVLDGVKTLALVAVVTGHSLAWHVTGPGQATNVLEVDRRLVVLTWLFQVLPLFFAAGAVANAQSWRRRGSADYLTARTRRLASPVLVYSGFWTALLLPTALVAPIAGQGGVFLAQLLWFAGVYLIVAAAVPVTCRWTTRPVTTFAVWGAVVVLIDVARTHGAPEAVGWLNLLAVWGLMHQIGYHLPSLRRRDPRLLVAAAAIAAGGAVALSVAGPYSSSLISLGTDAELSNLAPPSVVLALYGVSQIMLLAALWPTLRRWLGNDRVWVPLAVVGARAMGIYLWHIPFVALAAGIAMTVPWTVSPLGAAWWAGHLLVVAFVLPAAWFVAGIAQRPERAITRADRLFQLPVGLAAVGVGTVILDLSVTGFGTWWGSGMLGLPSATLPLVVLLWAGWQSSLPARESAGTAPTPTS